MKSVLISLLLLTAGIANADVRIQVPGSHFTIKKIYGYGITEKNLVVRTENGAIYIPTDVIEKTSLSMKELLDLFKEFQASKRMTLFFNGDMHDEMHVKSISSLLIETKD